MKNILFFIFIFFTQYAYAIDYSSYCALNIPKSTIKGRIESVSSISTLKRAVIKKALEHEFYNETKNSAKVDIETFWGVSINSGIFKKFSLTSNILDLEGLYISNFETETICPYNKVSYINKRLYFDENMVLKYTLSINQDNIDKTMKGDKCKKIIDDINKTALLSRIFKIRDMNIFLKEDKIVLNFTIVPDFIKITSQKPIKISLKAGLRVKNNKIELFDFGNNSIKGVNEVIVTVLNKFNPLNYDIKIDEYNKGITQIENVEIKNSKILVEGYFILKKTIIN